MALIRITTSQRVLLARGLRDFADGFAAILLPAYLAALGHGAAMVGLLAAVALLGSAGMTIGIGVVGGRIATRRLLLWAAALMVATGLAFAWFEAPAALLLVALLGTANPSAGTASLFLPLEQAVLAGTVAAPERTGLFARYSLIGALAAAVGALAAASPDAMQGLGFSQLAALRTMFLAYAAMGGVIGLLYWGLRQDRPADDEARSVLGPSRGIVLRLAALFSLDSFAGGLAVQSLLALWLFDRFGLSFAAAGLFFFWSGLLAALSFPVAAWLSRRIGLVNTMVFTHIPANLCLIIAMLLPQLEAVLALLLLRAALSSMDVPARTSYVMAVVTPPERLAAASFTSVPRSLAAAVGPALAAALYAGGFSAAPFLICGGLKIVYDLALLLAFRHLRPPEES